MNSLLFFRRGPTLISTKRCLHHKYQGTGVQIYDEYLKGKERSKANEGKENPLDYTIFGNKRKSETDVFFYSDRRSGKGFSNFSNVIYENRPYIWPPLRKLYRFNTILIMVGSVLCFINFDFFLSI
uniref:Uncharacterized protein n=1 Tax=Strongyloides stercoralis TaxID=6248 RepID=A0A0K0ER04_STRER